MEFDPLSRKVIGCAIDVHRALGPGLLENAYEQCLAHELKLNGIEYYLQKPIRPAELVELVELAFESIRLREEKKQSEEELRSRNRELEETIARLKKIIDQQ